MATVKSLEERTDQMADDVSSLVSTVDRLGLRMDNLTAVVAAVQAQLNAVLTGVQATQTQLALATQKVDASLTRMEQVEKKVETLSLSYTAFEARGELTNKFLKWVGGMTTVAVLALVGFSYGLTRHAGSIDEKIQHHQDTLNEVKRDLSDLRHDVTDIKTKLK